MMQPILKTIQIAYDKIKDFDHWCKNAFALTKDGHCASSTGGDAYCFCGIGAVYSAAKTLNVAALPVICTLQRTSEELFESRLVQTVNDDKSVEPEMAHKNVLKIYETAMERWKDRDPTLEEYSKK